MEKIIELLEGKTKEAQKRLEELFNTIGHNPKILWYPSAGKDYRDLLHLTDVRDNIKHREIRGNINIAIDYNLVDNLPDLFVHTDYSKDMVDLKKGEIFNDDRTVVKVEGLYELKINERYPIEYFVNPEFVDFPEAAPKSPEIYLLDIKIESNKLGVIKRPLIYFLFENINFLQEILLKHQINISHIVKVCEGLGFGGNRKSITVAYAFLSILKTEYLIIDDEVHGFDWELVEKLIYSIPWKFRPILKDFTLTEIKPVRQITIPINWNNRSVNVWKVKIKNKPLTQQRIKEILKPFDERWKARPKKHLKNLKI